MKQLQNVGDLFEFPVPIHHSRPFLPPVPSVARPVLVGRIEEGLTGRLVLLTAPAGWGKSSVLAEWARYTETRVAWVACDAVGNSPSQFVRSVVSAIDAVSPGFGGDLFAMLRSARPLPTEHLFSALQSAVAAQGDSVALVLDDFHLIDDAGILDGVLRLASSGPDRLRLVIAGRSAPPWPLARWRAYGEIVELDARDLAFTIDEATSLLCDECTNTEAIQALHHRSEGWVTGIRLAQLWLRSLDDASEVEATFRGSHRDIADYLAEEVMKHLPPETERFLMATAVLDRFNASVARAVSGIDRAGQILEQVEGQGLFVVPLDHERNWYRYHGIFREFLTSRLERLDPGMEADVHRRAASWFDAHGYPVSAAESYIQAGDMDAAADVVNRSAESLLLRDGETTTLIRLVEGLPKAALANRPELERYFAWALVLVGRLGEAESLAGEFETRAQEAPPERQRFLRAEVASIRSRIAAYRMDHDATIAYARTALQCADPTMDWFRADALLSLGFAYRAVGEIDEACTAFGQASSLGWSTGFAHAALWGSRYQALTFVSQGRIRDAEVLIERDMRRARDAGMVHGAAFAALLVGRGELRYERNDLAGARQDLTQALTLAQAVGDAKILMNVYVALAHLEEADGNAPEARDAIRRAVSVFDGPGEKAVEAWLALRHGDEATVRRWMEWYIDREGDQPSLSCGEMEQVMLGRAMLHLGEVQDSVSFLSALLDEAEASGRRGRALTIRILLAQAADAAGDEAKAFRLAREAMDLAMREGYIRSVLDEGSAVLPLLRRAMRRDQSAARREYARVFVAETEGPVAGETVTENSPLVEPLTRRQEEVLRLMAEGRSNREIADRLYVAEGTIKAHIHQIFSKLMVRNRTEAIRAAQHLGIVP